MNNIWREALHTHTHTHTHTHGAGRILPKGGRAGLSCCPPTLWKGGLRRSEKSDRLTDSIGEVAP